MTKPAYYDNSRLSDFKTCPRKYYFRHVLGLSSPGFSPPLAFGTSWHSAMDIVWGSLAYSGEAAEVVQNLYKTDPKIPPLELAKIAFKEGFLRSWEEETGLTLEDSPEELYSRHPMNALEMLVHYIVKNQKFLNSIKVDKIEHSFLVPLSQEENPSSLYCGIIDKKITTERGKSACVDHKTTSDYKREGGFKSTFLDSFFPNSQVEGYCYEGFLEDGLKFEGAYIDAALVHKVEHDKFKLIPIIFSPTSVESWLWETHYWVQEIENNLRSLASVQEDDPYLYAFPKKAPEACHLYFKPCPFIEICKSYPNPKILASETPEGYIVNRWEPLDEATKRRDRLLGEVS